MSKAPPKLWNGCETPTPKYDHSFAKFPSVLKTMLGELSELHKTDNSNSLKLVK